MRGTSASFGVLLVAAIAASACGDDKGDTGDSAATMTSQGPTTMSTNPGTTGGVDTMQQTGGATDATTGGPTTDPTTGGPTTDPTTGGGGDFDFCQESCSEDADCTIMGMDQGYDCVDGRCTSSQSLTCESNDECDALFSGWVKSCASQAECPGQVCISLEGMGLCATAPGNGITCDLLKMEELMVSTIEGAPTTVCGKTGTTCDRGVCKDPCNSDAECFPDAGYPHCNVDSGACECQSDADCAKIGQSAFSRCNQGICGCGADADCVGTNIDACQGGFCGCSSDAACTQKVFDGTMIGCG